MLGHCCESARHGKPRDVGLDKSLHRQTKFQIVVRLRLSTPSSANSREKLVYCSMLKRSSRQCAVRFSRKDSLVDKAGRKA